MVEGGSLENCCAARYRGFESYFLRQRRLKVEEILSMSKNKKQKFHQANLEPIKKLIKEKASDGDLSNQDIQDILKSTKDVYKETPLTEVDILKLYTTMVDELDSGVYGQRKVPVLLRIFGIIIAIS